MMKHCSVCKLEKENEEFYIHTGCAQGIRPECKKCLYESRAEYREAYKSKHNENNKSYYYSERTNSYRKDPRKYLYKVAKTRAKKQNQVFSISLEDINIPTHCPILKVKLDFFISDRKASYINAASLDRVNNELGYVPGNVRVISRKSNMMKRDLNIKTTENLLKYMKGEI